MAAAQSSDSAPDTLNTITKGLLPFTLACPSFIFRADYVENVCRLAPFVDEIQLLFFESRFEDSLPSPDLVDRLAGLGREKSITYSVHLPSDIFLGHAEEGERRFAADVLVDIIKRCAPLAPSTYTLHLERDPSEANDKRWQVHTTAALASVLDAGIDSRCISIENLNYDFRLAAPVVEALDLSVCMDMGHLLAHGQMLAPFYQRWQDRISVVHIHGVDGSRDHLPLDRLSPVNEAGVLDLIARFGGLVTVEVYSVGALETSLQWMKKKVEG
jgi:sugar phosphate isomerase/epimerase